LNDVEHTQVRYLECCTLKVGLLDLALASATSHSTNIACNCTKSLLVNIAHNWCYQALFERYSNTNVDIIVRDDARLAIGGGGVAGVQGWELAQCLTSSLHNHIVDRYLGVRCTTAVDLLAQLNGSSHINLKGHVDMWCAWLRVGHGASNRTAYAGHWLSICRWSRCRNLNGSSSLSSTCRRSGTWHRVRI